MFRCIFAIPRYHTKSSHIQTEREKGEGGERDRHGMNIVDVYRLMVFSWCKVCGCLRRIIPGNLTCTTITNLGLLRLGSIHFLFHLCFLVIVFCSHSFATRPPFVPICFRFFYLYLSSVRHAIVAHSILWGCVCVRTRHFNAILCALWTEHIFFSSCCDGQTRQRRQ